MLRERLQRSVREALPRPQLVHDCIVWSGNHLKAISRQAFVGNPLVTTDTLLLFVFDGLLVVPIFYGVVKESVGSYSY